MFLFLFLKLTYNMVFLVFLVLNSVNKNTKDICLIYIKIVTRKSLVLLLQVYELGSILRHIG
jgi:hypothetical protein